MEATAIPALRPLRVGELLDQAIRLYRRNFLTFVGIIAIVQIPYAIIQIAYSLVSTSQSVELIQSSSPQEFMFSPAYWTTVLGSYGIAFIHLILVQGLATAVLTHAIARNYMGEKLGILEAYRQLGTGWLKLLGALLLFFLVMIAAMIWFLIPCVGWLTGLGLVWFLTLVVAPLIPSVVVIEKAGGFRPTVRAWDLARRRFWWLLGFAFVIYLFDQLVVTGPVMLVSGLLGTLIGNDVSLVTQTTISTLVTNVTAIIFNLIFLPLQLTAWTLVYFDLRVRTEGFDLALLSLSTAEAGAGADISAIPPAEISPKWLTMEDVGKLVIITLVAGGIFAIFVALFAGLGLALSTLGGF